MARSSSPRERLETRIRADQKALLQRAADLTGRTLTDFVVASAVAAAEEAIRDHQVITLTLEDSIAFAEAVLNPPEPNADLRALVQRYREFVGE